MNYTGTGVQCLLSGGSELQEIFSESIGEGVLEQTRFFPEI